MSAACRG